MVFKLLQIYLFPSFWLSAKRNKLRRDAHKRLAPPTRMSDRRREMVYNRVEPFNKEASLRARVLHRSLCKLLSPVTVTDGFECFACLWGRGFQNLALYTAYMRDICMRSAWVYTAPSVTGDSNLYKLRYNVRVRYARGSEAYILRPNTQREEL